MSVHRAEIKFPLKGQSEQLAFSKQPPDTSPELLNVRSLDYETGRLRGFTRAGTSKYINAQVASGFVRDIGQVVSDDSQLTYSEFDDSEIEQVWRNATSGGNDIYDAVVDEAGNIYAIDGDSSFMVMNANGQVLSSTQVPIISGGLRRIAIDTGGNIYLGVGEDGTQADARLFKFRRGTIPNTYEIAWSGSIAMETTGLGATSAIGTVCYVSNIFIKGGDLYVAIADTANTEAEVQRYKDGTSTTVLSSTDLAFAVNWNPYGLHVRDDGAIFVSSQEGTGIAGDEQYLTKYDSQGAQVWQETASGISTAGEGGIGLACVADSEGNIFTYGPEYDISAVEGQTFVRRWLDEGDDYTIQWGVYNGNFPLASLSMFVRISLDSSDNVYVPWPLTTGSAEFQLKVIDKNGTGLAQFPENLNERGGTSVAVLPPSRPDYGSDAVTVDEYAYVAGRKDTDIIGATVRLIQSSTNATPIVLTVNTALYLEVGDEIMVGDISQTTFSTAHLLNLPANGRQTVEAVDAIAKTITLKDTTGIDAGVVTGEVEYLTAIKKLKLVDSVLGSGSQRSTRVLGVANGSIKKANVSGGTWTSITGGDGALNSTGQFISGVTLFANRFYTDGRTYKVYSFEDDEVDEYKATSYGQVPEKCRIISAWRGRIVLARSADDGHRWYMSKVGDPFDWDFYPVIATKVDAVDGILTDAGKIPDLINTFIPWNDDLAIWGCDHSIWRMTGDPLAGGEIDNISQTVGMAFGKSWDRDPQGNIIFMSTDGDVYVLNPGTGQSWVSSSLLTNLSEDDVDKLLSNIDQTQNFVRIVWSEEEDGFYVFQVPRITGGVANEHYFYSRRTKGWFPVEYAVGQPTCLYTLDGDRPADRVMLIGCEDGYVRKYDEEAKSDDGTAIRSEVLLGPYGLPESGKQLRLVSWQITLADNKGPVSYELYASDRADDKGSVKDSGDLQPGKNDIQFSRVKGEFFWLLLRARGSQPWGFESGWMKFATAGRQRATQ